MELFKEQRLSQIAEKLLWLDGNPFRLADYPMYRSIYDGRFRSTLLMCGRQVAKTVIKSARISLADGSSKEAKDVVVGDRVVTLSSDGSHTVTSLVTWVSPLYKKECREITTRQGHQSVFALTHPLRTWDAWTPTEHIRTRDRIAVLRRGGIFTGLASPTLERIRLTAYMLGDGHVGEQYYCFTQRLGVTSTEFMQDLLAVGGSFRTETRNGVLQFKLHRIGPLRAWMKEDELHDTRSHTKLIPRWVFDLSREHTALFLNRLWSTDGHVKRHSSSRYSVEYCTTSKRLIREVQALLWKFGVPTHIRRWKPPKGRLAYKLRIETQEGLRTFLSEIGALGKSEGIPLPTGTSNNNRDIE